MYVNIYRYISHLFISSKYFILVRVRSGNKGRKSIVGHHDRAHTPPEETHMEMGRTWTETQHRFGEPSELKHFFKAKMLFVYTKKTQYCQTHV